MTRIELDAASWRTEDDLWDSLLAALGAPDWHGRNLDALEETITESVCPTAAEAAINRVQPRFALRVINCGRLPSPVWRTRQSHA